MRRSSFAVMESIAKSRISTFQQTVEAEQARASKSDAKVRQLGCCRDATKMPASLCGCSSSDCESWQVRSEMRFDNKLQKFKRIENPEENASIGNEKLHTAALKTKLAVRCEDDTSRRRAAMARSILTRTCIMTGIRGSK